MNAPDKFEVETLLYPRYLANFREVSGIPFSGVRLFRSASFSQCQPEIAVSIHAQFGCCSYIDLRTQKEVNRDGLPTGIIDMGWRYVQIPIHDQCSSNSSDDERYQKAMPQYLQAAREVLMRLERGESCVLACSLGKDRTGMVIALIQHWIGESDEHISAYFTKSIANLIKQSHLLPVRWQKPSALTPISGRACIRALRSIEKKMIYVRKAEEKGRP